MIRGSAVGSVPHMVIGIMKQFDKPMKSASIYAAIAPELKVSRVSVGTALNELCKRKVVEKTGTKKPMLFSLTGVKNPVRVPIKPYWKSKNHVDCIEAISKKKQSETSVEIIELTPSEKAPPKKTKPPQAPELITCNECEWYGIERDCPNCKYVLPNEKATT